MRIKHPSQRGKSAKPLLDARRKAHARGDKLKAAHGVGMTTVHVNPCKMQSKKARKREVQREQLLERENNDEEEEEEEDDVQGNEEQLRMPTATGTHILFDSDSDADVEAPKLVVKPTAHDAEDGKEQEKEEDSTSTLSGSSAPSASASASTRSHASYWATTFSSLSVSQPATSTNTTNTTTSNIPNTSTSTLALEPINAHETVPAICARAGCVTPAIRYPGERFRVALQPGRRGCRDYFHVRCAEKEGLLERMRVRVFVPAPDDEEGEEYMRFKGGALGRFVGEWRRRTTGGVGGGEVLGGEDLYRGVDFARFFGGRRGGLGEATERFGRWLDEGGCRHAFNQLHGYPTVILRGDPRHSEFGR